MFEQVKTILSNDYNTEMNKFNDLKSQMTVIEENLKQDTSEEEYQNSIAELNKKYGIFKRGKEYKNELKQLQEEYYEKLKQFEEEHTRYIELKNEAAKINIYIIQKKLEQLNNANSLEDLKMTEEDAVRIINGTVE